MRVSTWGKSCIEHDNHQHVLVSVAFDYLIIPSLVVNEDYCSTLLYHEERKRLLFISRATLQLSRRLSRQIQLEEAPNNPYLKRRYLTLDWCWFARQPKYFFTADMSDWKTHGWRLDRTNRSVKQVKICSYYTKSLRACMLAETKAFLSARRQCIQLTQASFKLGKFQDFCDAGWLAANRPANRIRHTMHVFARAHHKIRGGYISRRTVRCKHQLLNELLLRRRICAYPLCNRLCFAPTITCPCHDYYKRLVQGKIIKPSTWTCLQLERSICDV